MITYKPSKDDLDDAMYHIESCGRDLTNIANNIWDWLVQIGLAIEEKLK